MNGLSMMSYDAMNECMIGFSARAWHAIISYLST